MVVLILCVYLTEPMGAQIFGQTLYWVFCEGVSGEENHLNL